MPRLILTERAAAGIGRCLEFVAERDEQAAFRAAAAVSERLAMLETHPLIGRPIADDLRELVIPFGARGYVARYRHDPARDLVIVLAFRHQREAGYL